MLFAELAIVMMFVECAGKSPAAEAPLLKLLPRFTTHDVPAFGPKELATTPRSWFDPPIPKSWWNPAVTPARQPEPIGSGLAKRPMLYAGEGYNQLFLVNHGKVVWTYACGGAGEIDDVWLMTNGHILYTHQNFIEEVTPEKNVVWHYDAPTGTEIHTGQPIGLDKVMFVQNGLPPKVIIVNKRTGTVELEHALPMPSPPDPKGVHAQFRRFRITAAGTYLAAHHNGGKVVEYDREFKIIWTYPAHGPWSAARLKNGNTLITILADRVVREVNAKGETVWEFNLQTNASTGQKSDLPDGILMNASFTAERLATGNTVICGCVIGEVRGGMPTQMIEVTPDKQVIWELRDWRVLGPATTAQLLDEPGIPENPGELQR